MSYLVFKGNPLVPLLFTFVANYSYTVLSSTSLLSTLLSLLKSTGTRFYWSTSIFKLAKPDVADNVDVSTAVAIFNSAVLV